MGYLKNAMVTFGKAQVSAWIASIVDFSITVGLSQLLHLWYGYCTFTGALMGGVINCLINYKWVFHPDDVKKKSIVTRYMIVWAGSIGLNTFGTLTLTELTGINFVVIKAIVAIAVAILWNYQLQKIFVFRSSNYIPLRKKMRRKRHHSDLSDAPTSE